MTTLTQADKDWIEQKISLMLDYGKVTRSSSNGDDATDGWGGGGQIPARRMGPWGLRSCPPVGSESLVLSLGMGNRIMIGADSTTQSSKGLEYSYGPKDMVEGETVLYAKSGQVIRLHDDGSITVIPKSGQKVKLGDGDNANLDQVALFTQLQIDFNNLVNKFNSHSHLAGTLIANTMTGAVTGATATNAFTTNQRSNSVASSNVVAKK